MNSVRSQLASKGIDEAYKKNQTKSIAFLAGLTGLLLVKKLPARVTNTGKVVTGDRPTKNQVEAAVRESRETPPDRVEDRIREQL